MTTPITPSERERSECRAGRHWIGEQTNECARGCGYVFTAEPPVDRSGEQSARSIFNVENPPDQPAKHPSMLIHENGCIVGVTLGEKQREELRRHAAKPHVGSCRHCAGAIPRLLDTVDLLENHIREAAKEKRND
jgi:hypothetical protein